MHYCAPSRDAERLTDSEIRRIQLDILSKIDEFCSRNSIQYSLSGGSMIGAVRHKGFIPWDDDIDIFIERSEYKRFLATFNGNYPNLVTVDYLTDPDYSLPFAKVMDMSTQIVQGGNRLHCYGIFVDIFPLDGQPGDDGIDEYVNTFTSMYRRLHKAAPLYKFTSNPAIKLKLAVRSLFHKGRKEIAEKMDAYLSSFKFAECKFAGEITGGSGKRVHIPVKTFEKYGTLDFEGEKRSCITDSDTYLTSIYGDYMKFPPAREQKPKHKIKAYRIV